MGKTSLAVGRLLGHWVDLRKSGGARLLGHWVDPRKGGGAVTGSLGYWVTGSLGHWVTRSLGRSLGDRDVVIISNLLTEALKTIDILVVKLGKLIGARSAPKKK